MNFIDSNFVKCTEKQLCETVSAKELCGKKILVGLSGGADSTALLLSLYALRERLGFSLCACHVNHMIRGSEADRDEEFSRALCERYDIPFSSIRKDVPALSRELKKGLEEAARDVRYEYFSSLCSESAGFIATAHTASDNAETILFNIIRGCGTNGLCGIPKRRGNVIRPILFAQRSDVEAFLSEIGESYVTDSTNLTDDCTRNVIRHSIIPQIEGLNPAFARAFGNLSTLALRDCEYLDDVAKRSFTDDISMLSSYDESVSSRIIGEMYRRESGFNLPLKNSEAILSEIKRMVREKDGEARQFSLPGMLIARIECGKISIENETCTANSEKEYEVRCNIGVNELCGGDFLAVISRGSDKSEDACKNLEHNQNFYSLFMEARLFSGIISSIILRSGRSGDKIRISGMSKDIRKMYSAKKIPLNMRKLLPRICDEESGEIVALPYVGVNDAHHAHLDESDISVLLYEKLTRSDYTDNEQKE